MPPLTTTSIKFLRLEGCGNNFTVVHDLDGLLLNSICDLTVVSKAIQDQHFGVGGDGLMIVTRSATHHFAVTMRNPDGSSMGMCGNGIRCVARSIYLEDLCSADTQTISFDVEGRTIICRSESQGQTVTVNMGAPSFAPKEIPTTHTESLINFPILVHGKHLEVTSVSMGNPHAVIFCSDLDAIPLDEWGPTLEHHELFPKRTNVEFVKVLSPSHYAVRVWERGVGPTLACGTGACAVLMAGLRTGRGERRAQISLPGGALYAEFIDESVFLTGPARHVASGAFSNEFFAPLLKIER